MTARRKDRGHAPLGHDHGVSDTPEETEAEFRQPAFEPPPGAAQLLLVRHGESAPYRHGEPFPLVGGQGDPPLHPVGEEQAERVGERLAHEDLAAIYVTTLQRTAQTAAPLAERLGLIPVVEADLREVHLGEWEGGEFRKHVAHGHPAALAAFEAGSWDPIPGAEQAVDLEARVRAAVNRIAAAHADQCVAVFSHGGVISQIAAIATGGRPFSFLTDNAAVSHLVVDADQRWLLRTYNDTTHLHPGLTRRTPR